MCKNMIQKILHLSDTHGLHRLLDTLPDANVLVHSGDFTMGRTEKEALDFMEWLIALPHPQKIFIAGNHDDCLYRASLDGLPDNVHYLCHSGIEIGGLRFYGMPMFIRDSISGMEETYVRQIPPRTDILITHQPPLGIRDYSGHIHWGSFILLKQLHLIKPKLHLFGHIHDNYGVEKTDGIICVNSSLVNNQYELVNEPKLLVISAPAGIR